MIPKKFTLGGCDWVVKLSEDPENGDNLGECFFTSCQIKIQKKLSGKDISQQVMESTFYHELVHAILHMGEYHDLCDDEKLVSHIGNLLHQFERTKK